MKIALIGYGKMGHAIEQAAQARGHEIVVKIDKDNQEEFDSEAFKGADVAIEFTSPTTAEQNCRKAMDRGVKVVSGSTGWTDKLEEMKQECDEKGGTLLWSSNYSLGVNVFFSLNRYLARLMAKFPEYKAEIEEVHHVHKLDHPSGTAVSLARGIIEEDDRYEGWSEDENCGDNEVLIRHRREGEVAGIHTVDWESAIDSISITHSAKSRQGFAVGAVVAAEWVKDQKGFLTMDMLMDYLLK